MRKVIKKELKPVFIAIFAASLYGISAAFSKVLLNKISPLMMASLLYLGAGAGMLVIKLIQLSVNKKQNETPLTKKDLPYTILMVLFDIAAPILLMFGLKLTSAGSTALLNNFEIVATSLIALIIFKEAVGKRMWAAIILITAASMLLSFEDIKNFTFSIGSFFVLLACVSWGFENNCTRKLSEKDPIQIVIIKGFGSGTGGL